MRTTFCLCLFTQIQAKCESWIGQNYKQEGNYLVRLEDLGGKVGFYILVRRKPSANVSCCRECTDEKLCIPCSHNSPITRFRRIRKIFFRPVFPDRHNTPYEVSCSCPYQPMIGVPCHHICLFLLVLPRHINTRYLCSYDVLWRRPGHEAQQDYYRKRLRTNALFVTFDEYMDIIKKAKTESSPREMFCGPCSIPVQLNSKGVVVRQTVSVKRCAITKTSIVTENPCNEGGLIEEYFKPKGPPGSRFKNDLITPQRPVPAPHQEGDPDSRLGRMLNELMDVYSADPDGSAEFESEFTDLFNRHMSKARLATGMEQSVPLGDKKRKLEEESPLRKVTPDKRRRVSAQKEGPVGMKSVNFIQKTTSNRWKSKTEPARPSVRSKSTPGQALVGSHL